MIQLIKVNLPYQSELVLKTYNVPHKNESGEIELTKHEIKTLVSNPEYFRLKQDYLIMIQRYRETIKDQFIGGMPIQIQKDCLKQFFRINPGNNQLVYSITLKVDGERFLFFIGHDSVIYLIDRSTNFFYFQNESGEKVKLPGNAKKPFLLDGELVIHKDSTFEFLVFDCLFYPDQKGVLRSWLYDHFTTRLLVAKEAVGEIGKYLPKELKITLKPWFPITEILSTKNIYEHVFSETNKNRTKKLVSDGLILQPNDTAYVPFREWNTYNNVQFKWKPADELTIDFKIKVISDRIWYLLTQTDQVYMINQPEGDPVAATCYPTAADRRNYKDSDVVEFKYKADENPQGNLFEAYRLRNEKKANSYKTIMSTLESIHNTFYIDSLREPLKIITSSELFTKNGLKTVLSYYSKNDLVLWSLKDSMFFTNEELKKMEEVYISFIQGSRESSELEFRIYTSTKKNKSMDKSTFFYLLDFLWISFPIVFDSTIDIYLNSSSKDKYRSTYLDLNGVYSGRPVMNTVKKSLGSFSPKDQKTIYNGLTFKLDYSREENSEKVIGLRGVVGATKVTNMIRVKSRKSFRINELWRLDLTRVKTSYSIRDVFEKNETYEFECEYTGPTDLPFNDFAKSLSDLYKIILSNSGYC
jgi:hypothetical protein